MFAWAALDAGVGAAFTDGDVDLSDPSGPGLAAVAAELGLGGIVTLTQVHGASVQRVDEESLPRWEPAAREGDALVSTLRADPPVALCVRAADCVPVLFHDVGAGVIGAAHAGRVGFDAGVLDATVAAMRGLGAGAITAVIGPHICGGCYEVPADMAAEIAARHPAAAARTTWGTPAVDLGEGAAAALTALGCTVVRADPCTREVPSLPSYRRDGPKAGRLGGLIWLS